MFTPGQKVYTCRMRTKDWRTGEREESWEEHTIVKVGRKYATTVNRTRIMLETGHSEGGERFWQSKEEKVAEDLRSWEWRALRSEFGNNWNPPKHITVEVIGQIRSLLQKGSL